MKTVYAVSSGEYSDYSVECLFERSDDAEAYIERLSPASYQHYRVEEFGLYGADEKPQRRRVFAVLVDEDGNETKRWEFEQWEHDAEGVDSARVYSGARGISDRGYEQALKAARDILAKHKAQDAGL